MDSNSILWFLSTNSQVLIGLVAILAVFTIYSSQFFEKYMNNIGKEIDSIMKSDLITEDLPLGKKIKWLKIKLDEKKRNGIDQKRASQLEEMYNKVINNKGIFRNYVQEEFLPIFIFVVVLLSFSLFSIPFVGKFSRVTVFWGTFSSVLIFLTIIAIFLSGNYILSTLVYEQNDAA